MCPAVQLNDAPLAIVDKRRSAHNVSEVMNLIGDVRGKVAVLVDDMIDTAGTITNAAKVQPCFWGHELPMESDSADPVSGSRRDVSRTSNLHCACPAASCRALSAGHLMRRSGSRALPSGLPALGAFLPHSQ